MILIEFLNTWSGILTNLIPLRCNLLDNMYNHLLTVTVPIHDPRVLELYQVGNSTDHTLSWVSSTSLENQKKTSLQGNCFYSSLSSSSPLVPLLQRWKQWTVEAKKKLVMMATTDTEMPEKMMMSRSVRVRVAWHSRKLSFESCVRETRLPSMGREHSMPSTPETNQKMESN